MGPMKWLTMHWLDIVQTVGITGGLVFTGWSGHRDGQAQRAANLLKLTEQHRDLWKELFTRPALARVLSAGVDLTTEAVTEEETMFVTLLILHLNAAYSAIRAGVLREPEGLTPDIRGFFSLPIPLAVWERMKHLHDAAFVAFVEARKPR
jgi:hypothetical protein